MAAAAPSRHPRHADGLNAEFFGDGRYTVLAVVNIGKPGEGAWYGRAPRLDYDEAVSSV